jgi:signal peptidase I
MGDWTPQADLGADLGTHSVAEAASEAGSASLLSATASSTLDATADILPVTAVPPASWDTTPEADRKIGAPEDGFKQLRVWMRDLAVSVCLAGFVILFLYQPVKVEGTSMEPRLTDQERVFINKFIYRIESVERGDVVVFWYPKDRTKSFIKRIVGVPGDRVEMRAGELFVNGKQIAEPYLASNFRGEDSFAPVLVPLGEYFVLGDHRTSSNDSRSWGTVPQKYIYGKAQLVYWPVGKWGLLD